METKKNRKESRFILHAKGLEGLGIVLTLSLHKNCRFLKEEGKFMWGNRVVEPEEMPDEHNFISIFINSTLVEDMVNLSVSNIINLVIAPLSTTVD